ncbi:MAG: hypothetical protein WC375_05610, partial [Methanomassiliicoccales archaeon]
MHIPLQQWINLFGGDFQYIKPPSTFHCDLPKMLKKEDTWIWQEIVNRTKGIKTSAQFIGLANNLFCSFDGCVRSKDDYIEEFGAPSSYSRLPDTGDNLCVNLMDRWGGTNYWHWTSTCLSKLYLLQKMKCFSSFSDYYYLVNSLNNNFARTSLSKFGINAEKCFEV